MEAFPVARQREALIRLAALASVSLRQLRRDDCLAWALLGRFGRVYPLACSYQIMISGWEEDDPPWTTARGWNLCKAAMSFARLTQDGDEEGAFILDRDPTAAEAQIIRKYVGLKKRRRFDDETLAAMSARGKALSAGRAGARP